jgi:cyclohexa-1,5-dienecarbonyl-CoA hydratase
MSVARVTCATSPDGAVRTLVLDGPPGNVVGIATCERLLAELQPSVTDPRTRLIVLQGAGANFSYGASIEEHLPETAPRMLDAMGTVVRLLAGLPVPTLAAIRGRCLGGGFELALACGMAWAEAGSVLGAPEIKLGVFAPAATALLEDRVPRGVREELLLTGRDVPADEALRLGLLTRIVPAGALEAAVDAFASEHLRGRSGVGLRAATTAIRSRPWRQLRRRLAGLERLYKKELLGPQGSEGIRAWIEKRPARWEDA